jgi:predicted N-acetyltransferase YhbS
MRNHAVTEQAMGLSSVTVAIDVMKDGKVVGYFSLSPLSIRLDPRVLATLGLPADRIPYPSVGGFLLGRLGVEKSYQGQGIGEALVAIAVDRCRKQRESTGGVFLAVDAKTDGLISYYAKLGFGRLGESKRLMMRL